MPDPLLPLEQIRPGTAFPAEEERSSDFADPPEVDQTTRLEIVLARKHLAGMRRDVYPARQAVRFQAARQIHGVVGATLEADPTLGGLAFGLTYGRPETSIEAVPGAPAIKSAVVEIVVDYETPSPLA